MSAVALGPVTKTKSRVRPLPSSISGAKEIARLRHNRLCCDYCDLQRRQQAHHAGAFVADIDADRPGARHRGEGLGYTSGGVDHLIGTGIRQNPWILCEVAEQRNRQVMRWSIENAVRIAGDAENGIAQSRGRTIDDLDRGDSI